MGGRRPGDALDIVGPEHRLTGSLFHQMSRDIHGLAQIFADPSRTVDAPGDDGSVLVDDLHDTVDGEVVQPEPVLEMFELNADAHNRGQLPRSILDRPRQSGHPFVGGASKNRLADCKPLTAQHALEIVAVGVVGAAVFRHLE